MFGLSLAEVKKTGDCPAHGVTFGNPATHSWHWYLVFVREPDGFCCLRLSTFPSPREHKLWEYFQSIVGVMIQACMVGIIFSKLARPKKRASTLMFSRNAVVCQRDGTNCLLFRFWNSHSMLKLFLTWSQGGQHETHITSGGSCASHPYKVVS